MLPTWTEDRGNEAEAATRYLGRESLANMSTSQGPSTFAWYRRVGGPIQSSVPESGWPHPIPWYRRVGGPIQSPCLDDALQVLAEVSRDGIAALQERPGAATVLRRCRASAADTKRIGLPRLCGRTALEPDLVLPRSRGGRTRRGTAR